MNLCERSNQTPGARVSWQCWEQAGIDLEGAKKRAAAAESDGEETIGEEERMPL